MRPVPPDGFQGACNFAGIGQGTHGGAEIIRKILQDIRQLHMIPLHNIPETGFPEPVLQTDCLLRFCLLEDRERHSAVQRILLIVLLLLSSQKGMVFPEGQGIDPHLISSAAEGSHPVLCGQPGAAPSHMDVRIAQPQEAVQNMGKPDVLRISELLTADGVLHLLGEDLVHLPVPDFPADGFRENCGIPAGEVQIIIQGSRDDLIRRNSLGDEPVIIQIEKKETLSASPDSGDDLESPFSRRPVSF